MALTMGFLGTGLGLALAAWAAPALIPVTLFSPLYSALMAAGVVTLSVEAFNTGARRAAEEIVKDSRDAAEQNAVAPASARPEAPPKKTAFSLLSRFRKTVRKNPEAQTSKTPAAKTATAPDTHPK